MNRIPSQKDKEEQPSPADSTNSIPNSNSNEINTIANQYNGNMLLPTQSGYIIPPGYVPPYYQWPNLPPGAYPPQHFSQNSYNQIMPSASAVTGTASGSKISNAPWHKPSSVTRPSYSSAISGNAPSVKVDVKFNQNKVVKTIEKNKKKTEPISVLTPPSTSKTSCVAPKEEWTTLMKLYVERAFMTCKIPAERDKMEQLLRVKIKEAVAGETVNKINWATEPIPIIGGYSDAGPIKSNLHLKQESKQPSTVSLNLDESKKLERAKRFEADQKAFKMQQEQNQLALQNVCIEDNQSDVIDWDEYTIVGTCQKLEKPYLRLTSAPDPGTVRPLPVLKSALKMLKEKWRNKADYGYICDQFKSLRQDMTVQRIKSDFTVQVYEIHARIAIEQGDLGQYNQCQTQLKELYAIGLSGCKFEFLSYRLLYLIHCRNKQAINQFISELTEEQRANDFVSHALQVRSAEALCNYSKLFQLYNAAPNMGAYLMDLFVARERSAALNTIIKAYRPTCSIPFLTKTLAFSSEVDCRKWLSAELEILEFPATYVVPNKFQLNSSSIPLGAFLSLTAFDGTSKVARTSFDVICIECQKKYINDDPDLLPNTKLDILYYDTSFLNTSKASIAALEFSLTSNHIASFGPDSADLLLPITKYFQSLKIAAYSPSILSSTFSSLINFPNLRTITVSDYYLTQNYVQLMKFFGWTWVAAAFADDDIGQSGRYSFAQFSDDGLYFPCFYIIGTQNDAGLSALTTCIQNYTDIKVLLLWGGSSTVANAINYLYEQTNLTYLTFVINPTAAVSINFNLFEVPTSFFQGSIFLSENYDQDAGFYDCIEKFLNDASTLPPVAREVYENEFNCVLSKDESLPLCKTPKDNLDNKDKCRCLIEGYDFVSRPYTQNAVLYRDILQSYALALNRILYKCTSLQGNYCDLDSITGEELLEAVSQNSFVGFSGLISYNRTKNTNRLNGTLNVYQVVESYQTAGRDSSYVGPQRNSTLAVYAVIGFMTPKAVSNTDGIFLDQSLFHFKTGGDTVPISIPTPETTDLSSGFWPCFIFSLSILGLILAVCSLAFIIWKWNTPTVRKAGQLFLMLILAGICCIFTANLLWSVQVSILICVIKGILCYLGVTLCCGALFAKAVEYYILFTNCRKRSYEKAISDRAITFCIAFGIVFVNSLLWYLLYILVAGPILCESFQSDSDFYYWYLGCLPANTSSDDIYHIMWIALTSAINFFAVILLAISWDLVSIYDQARCIVFVECNLIVLAVTILPLYYSLPQYPNYSLQQFLVRSLSSTFATYFTLLFIFAPLIYSFYSDDDDDAMIAQNAAASSGYDPLNLRLD